MKADLNAEFKSDEYLGAKTGALSEEICQERKDTKTECIKQKWSWEIAKEK